MVAKSSSSKKPRGSYKKLTPQQIRTIVNATRGLENLALRFGVSPETVKRVRRTHKQGVLTPTQLSDLKQYCFNETIRNLRQKKRKAKCNLIKSSHVIQNYNDSVKNNKKFVKLQGQKVPCLNWFKEAMKNHANKNGPNVYVAEVFPNSELTEEQDGRRRAHANLLGY